MAHEKLIIKNFIGIKDLELEINRFNVFIGPQASGKSVIVKLIHFFKSIVQEMEEFLTSNGSQEYLSEKLKETFFDYFPYKFLGNKKFTIEYIFHDGSRITLHADCSVNIEIDFCKETIHAHNKKREAIKDHSSKDGLNLEHLTGRGYFRPFTLCRAEPIFIPAGRAFFSIFQENIFRFFSSNPRFDPFIKSFGNIYESLRSDANSLYSEKNATVSKLVKNLLHGKYEFKDGKGYLKLDDREVDLEHSSSGQQEVLPLVLTLLSSVTPLYQGALIIEEPEAHLFPESQKHITELIASVFNSDKNKKEIFITTHSPYILTALNTLLYAGQIAEKLEDKTQLDRIVPLVLRMHFEDVSVWALDNKGNCKFVMNKETGLIDAEIIDEVSNNISEEFCKLVDLDE